MYINIKYKFKSHIEIYEKILYNYIMKSQMKELKEWLEQKQIEIHSEEMSENQNTIYSTLQLVKRQVEYITQKNTNKPKNCGSPGYHGC